MSTVHIFTDGSCLGNPGPGGYAAILKFGPHQKVVSGKSESTTNNRAELAAAVAGLKALKRPCRVELHTDSEYLIKVASGAKAKANLDLVLLLRELTAQHTVEFVFDPEHPVIAEEVHDIAREKAHEAKSCKCGTVSVKPSVAYPHGRKVVLCSKHRGLQTYGA